MKDFSYALMNNDAEAAVYMSGIDPRDAPVVQIRMRTTSLRNMADAFVAALGTQVLCSPWNLMWLHRKAHQRVSTTGESCPRAPACSMATETVESRYGLAAE